MERRMHLATWMVDTHVKCKKIFPNTIYGSNGLKVQQMIVVGHRSTSIFVLHLGIRLEAKEQQTKKVGSTSDVNMKEVPNYSKDRCTSNLAAGNSPNN